MVLEIWPFAWPFGPFPPAWFGAALLMSAIPSLLASNATCQAATASTPPPLRSLLPVGCPGRTGQLHPWRGPRPLVRRPSPLGFSCGRRSEGRPTEVNPEMANQCPPSLASPGSNRPVSIDGCSHPPKGWTIPGHIVVSKQLPPSCVDPGAPPMLCGGVLPHIRKSLPAIEAWIAVRKFLMET